MKEVRARKMAITQSIMKWASVIAIVILMKAGLEKVAGIVNHLIVMRL